MGIPSTRSIAVVLALAAVAWGQAPEIGVGARGRHAVRPADPRREFWPGHR